MPRVGFDGRDLLRQRTGVVNNAVYLARELSKAHPSEVIVYVDRPRARIVQAAQAGAESTHADAQAAQAGAESAHASAPRAHTSPADFSSQAAEAEPRSANRSPTRTTSREASGMEPDPPQAASSQSPPISRRGEQPAPAEDLPLALPVRELSAPRLTWKHLALPLALGRDGCKVFHSPTGTLPLWAPCRQVVTIHDLFAAIEPGWFTPRIGWQLRLTQRRAAHAADQVIAVSERTRRDLIERFNVPEGKISVVYNGVDHSRFQPAEVDAEAVARRYGVRYPFILCVGSLMPWRNAPRLLRAASQLKFGLLFVGRDIWGTDPTERLAAQNGWDWARFAGYVPDAELPRLYAAARVFAYPSLYEGFGIPPVEAMACGTPVVASTAGALPEMLGDAALLVDPRDEAALAEALEAAADDRGALRRRGLERAARYRWDLAAQQTWQVYAAAAASSR